MRSLLLLLLPLLAAVTILQASHGVAAAAAVEGQKRVCAGCWEPITNLSDPHIQEIAEFAVAEHDRQKNDTLTFDRVVDGQSQVVAGMNYRLILVATDGRGASADYKAMVWEQVWRNFTQLTSFERVWS